MKRIGKNRWRIGGEIIGYTRYDLLWILKIGSLAICGKDSPQSTLIRIVRMPNA